MEEVNIGGVAYTVERVQSDSKYASASVRGTAIRIRIPVHMPREEAFHAYLDLKRRLIKRIERRGTIAGDAPVSFQDHQTVRVLGRDFTPSVSEVQGRRGSSARLGAGGTIEIILAPGLGGQEKSRHIDSLARRVIASAVQDQVQERVKLINDKHFGFEVRAVRVGAPSETRWGSCSIRTKRINLSFRLLFAPQAVMDSVIVHELAHLKVASHSDAFWGLVYGAMPDYKEVRRWLNKNGHRLAPGFMPDDGDSLSGAAANAGHYDAGSRVADSRVADSQALSNGRLGTRG